MYPNRSARFLIVMAGLLLLPGCHILVQLGEADQSSDAGGMPVPQPSPPSSGPQTPPPLPCLPDGDSTLKPPPPGLSPDNESEKPKAESGLSGNVPTKETTDTRLAALEARLAILDARLSSRRSSTSSLYSQPSSLHSGPSTLNPPPSPDRMWAIRSRLSGNTGINTNTAISPGEGQIVYRTQLRFLQAHSSPGPGKADVNVLVNPQILAYGLRENLSLFGVVPLVKRDGTVRPPKPAGAFRELDDFGVGDMRFFAKYRFYNLDEQGETTRWSVFGGIEAPSYDKDFSSDSWDPFVGTVWTYQSLRWGLDLDWFWNFNTGTGTFRHDEMRYDSAYTYVLLIGQTVDDKFWQLNSIFEFNGSYLTDGSHLLYAAPGFQLAMPHIIVEASLQLPVIRDLKNRIEPDYTAIIGTRITW